MLLENFIDPLFELAHRNAWIISDLIMSIFKRNETVVRYSGFTTTGGNYQLDCIFLLDDGPVRWPVLVSGWYETDDGNTALRIEMVEPGLYISYENLDYNERRWNKSYIARTPELLLPWFITGDYLTVFF